MEEERETKLDVYRMNEHISRKKTTWWRSRVVAALTMMMTKTIICNFRKSAVTNKSQDYQDKLHSKRENWIKSQIGKKKITKKERRGGKTQTAKCR